MDNKKLQKLPKKYTCVFCDYNSHNFSNYKKHIETIKHKRITMDNKSNKCECGKMFAYASGLCKHRKVCKQVATYKIRQLETKIGEMKDEKDALRNIIIDTLQKQVNEKDEQIKALLPKVGSNNITFNINNFLNDECKDAISLEDFIKNITVSVENLLLTNTEGISTGITNIILENMNKLSINERPFHCSDKKRETIYIKNNIWEKDQQNKNTKHLIKKICHKQVSSLSNVSVDEIDVEMVKLVNTCTDSVDEKKVMKKLCDGLYIGKMC
tara:strand:+ start:238 stop:1047 length:810 start_codon:yes stop_codon:yes gene_type:complete